MSYYIGRDDASSYCSYRAKIFFCATIRSNPLYHFQGGTTIRHTHGSTTSREAQPYATLMAAPLQGGTTIRHTHGSTTSRVVQPYTTLMAVPLPGWHNHTPHSWQHHFQGGTTIRHTHGSTTSREAQPYSTLMAGPLAVTSFLLLIAVSATTSIALSWRCCGDLHWEVRKWKGLDQGTIIPSSITATIFPQ